MLFNSYAFALFFACALPHLLAARPVAATQNVLLLGAAYYFYSCWDARFLSLLVLSTVMDYACGLWVDASKDPSRRRAVVALSMAQPGNARLFQVLQLLRREPAGCLGRARARRFRFGTLKIVLPIGISFYTFQSMSYVIDVYRREIKPTRNLVQFAAFVSFFPHLVAGPIMRPTTLAAAGRAAAAVRPRPVLRGVLPDLLGAAQEGRRRRQPGGDRQGSASAAGRRSTAALALLAVYAFAFQIYGDFSGYTDIARGVAKCLGFELPLEFQPALLRDQPPGLLEPVAHQPVAMAAGLPLHLAGRQPRRHACGPTAT